MFPYEDSKTVSVRTPRKKSPWLRQCQSYISNLYINGKVFTSFTPWPWKPKKLIFFSNWGNLFLSVTREKKSPCLPRYQSYISNWCINGKVFTSTTAWKPKRLNYFSKKFEIEFCLYPEKRNCRGFVYISPTLVIDTSMERSLQVLQHENIKIWFFFSSKKFEIEFWLVPKRWNCPSRSQHEPIWRYRGCIVIPSRVGI